MGLEWTNVRVLIKKIKKFSPVVGGGGEQIIGDLLTILIDTPRLLHCILFFNSQWLRRSHLYNRHSRAIGYTVSTQSTNYLLAACMVDDLIYAAIEHA